MRPSLPDQPQSCEEIQALRREIARLAERSGIDLADRAVLRRVLDGNFCTGESPFGDRQPEHQLTTMLTLLFRLETSSSEDLGIVGLVGLWREHGRILAHCRTGQVLAG